jgi:hypothetical protein
LDVEIVQPVADFYVQELSKILDFSVYIRTIIASRFHLPLAAAIKIAASE